MSVYIHKQVEPGVCTIKYDRSPLYEQHKEENISLIARENRMLNILQCDMRFCRKVFTTHLRQNGNIPAEIIDALQGRIPASVFTRHYFTPSLEYRKKILDAIQELKQNIEQK